MRLSVLVLVVLAVAALPAFPEEPAASAYVLSESGVNATSLAYLTIAAEGSITGSEVIRTGGRFITYAVQGAAVASEDGTRTLTINATSTDAFDDEGAPLLVKESRVLIALSSGGYVTLRTDHGLYAYGELLVAAAAPAAGSYVALAQGATPAPLGLDVVTVGPEGVVAGKRMAISLAGCAAQSFGGAMRKMPNGFYAVRFDLSSTDPDGNQVMTTENFLALPTTKDIRMIPSFGASGMLTLAR